MIVTIINQKTLEGTSKKTSKDFKFTKYEILFTSGQETLTGQIIVWGDHELPKNGGKYELLFDSHKNFKGELGFKVVGFTKA